jgi:hypothetical protein
MTYAPYMAAVASVVPSAPNCRTMLSFAACFTGWAETFSVDPSFPGGLDYLRRVPKLVIFLKQAP